ncbi:MAG: hypothetical protein RIQ89_166 [Bacteroidota bacterium]|jgi:hypothetical protein
MAENKTKPTQIKVEDFIQSFVTSDQKKADSFALIELMKKATGHQPVMWGPSIIGFGTYHYTYPSGHSGSAPTLGFSPRKAAISLYVFTGLEQHKHLLNNLGKFKVAKACIYINKLSDINLQALNKLMEASLHFLKQKYKTE